MVLSLVSWPGLARPPTTSPVSARQVVDGRHMAGHDTVGAVAPQARYFNAYAGLSGPPIAAQVVEIKGTIRPFSGRWTMFDPPPTQDVRTPQSLSGPSPPARVPR